MSWLNPSFALNAIPSKSNRVKSTISDGFVGHRPARHSRRTRSETPSSENRSIGAETLTQTELARYSNLVANLKSSLRQAVMELDEAANIFAGQGLNGTANIFRLAAERKRKDLERAHV